MARQQRITVRGKQRMDIDPLVFLQVLLAISEDWDRTDDTSRRSSDAFHAAIEDVEESAR